MLYNETVEIQRLSDDGVGKSYQTHIAEYDCMIQPFDSEKGGGISNTFGQDEKMYGDKADIQEDDRVVRDGENYSVVGVERYSGRGDIDHLKVIIRG